MITAAEVPSAIHRPARAARSPLRRELIKHAFSRRSFIKGVLVVSGAGLLAGVEGVLTRIGALAAPPTWTNCADYRAAQISHYGLSYANGEGRWWVVCNPFASDVGGGDIGWDQIGNQFCGDAGYHRTDSVTSGGLRHEFSRRSASCAGKNAWSWKVSLNTAWQNKHSRRCSDGQRATFRGTELIARINTACRKNLPDFDPPASTLPFDQYTPDRCDPDVQHPSNC